MTSAIALQNIFPGAAVAQKGDTVTLAGAAILASHIVIEGGPVRGLVSMLAVGQVSLNDWTLAAGTANLTPGTTYYVAAGGRLAKTGVQPIGIAISKNILSVTIQNQQAAQSVASSTASLQAQIDALALQITTLAGQVPKMFNGSWPIGDASNSGTVTGLGISGFAPTRAIATVRIPTTGLHLTASIVAGTITVNGFDFQLSGLTDSPDYILDFTMSA